MTLFLSQKRLADSTGGRVEVHLHNDDAAILGIVAGDRVAMTCDDSELFAVAEVVRRGLKPGQIGLVKDTLKKFRLKSSRAKVHVRVAPKSEALEFIKKKMNGYELNEDEIESIVGGIVDYSLSDIDVCYFISAVYYNKMTLNETAWTTKAIAMGGDRLSFGKELVVDKHCIGGVPGNRTTLMAVPIMTALGYKMPKSSSRSITSPAGTADTMETLCSVVMDAEQMGAVVKKAGGCVVMGGGSGMASADDRMIRIRHSLHLDPEGLLLSSVMAKKFADGANCILIDIPYGDNTKVATKKEAKILGKKFTRIGKVLGLKVGVSLSYTLQNIGYGVGPALEMRDVIRVLNNDKFAPQGYKKHGLELTAELLHLARGGSKSACLADCRRVVEDGSALKAFHKICAAQGLNYKATAKTFANKTNEYLESVIGKNVHEVYAEKNGKLKSWNIKRIAEVAFVAGAPADKGAGVECYAKVGDNVKSGTLIMKIYSNSPDRLNFAVKNLLEDKPYTI
jgi:putative thymidine phosphorylase